MSKIKRLTGGRKPWLAASESGWYSFLPKRHPRAPYWGLPIRRSLQGTPPQKNFQPPPPPGQERFCSQDVAPSRSETSSKVHRLGTSVGQQLWGGLVET